MAQTLYHNGVVLTVDGQDRIAEAVLTDSARIVAVGARAEVEAQARPDADRRDLGGRCMIPAFVDPHGHFPDSGVIARYRADLSTPPLGACATLADVCDRLAERAARTPAGAWVIGAMFEPGGVREGRFPTRAELDAISTDHPVWVIHVSGHAGVANSAALALRGVDEETPAPPGGRFGRDASTRRLDGLLEGMAAMGALGDTEFQIDEARFRGGVEAAAREYLAQGVTLAQNAWATPTLLGYFIRLAEQAAAPIDVMVLPAGFLEPRLSAGEWDLRLPEDGRVLFGPRKFFGDGSFHLQTACLTEPYHRPLNGDPTWRCPPSVTAAQMVEKLGVCHDLGQQLHIHANGDATADIMLDAIARLQDRNPRDDHRHTLIHSQRLRPDQLDRMAALGVGVSFFPAHLHYWGDFHRDVTFGPERVHAMCPTRWAAERGLRFTIHNDAPVTPTRPLHLMSCAVNRRSVSGAEIGPGQALTPREALRAHTIDAAWQVFQEVERGSIEPGKRADFAILPESPLEHAARIHEIEVVETVMRGESVYRRDAAA